ncbi:MAG: D-aminoacylase, partial [Flavobacteriaceae bacterium]|nr:D-aminoacylase [Flavobacteriaceae bacterium]
MKNLFILISFFLLILSCEEEKENPRYDVIIRNGNIIDGTNSSAFKGDIGINADSIAFIGDLTDATAEKDIDASGLTVAPGFINMLSWAVSTLIEDGKSQSDIRQGVTLEVFGEGWSMGPLNEKMKESGFFLNGDIEYDVEWNTLGEYLEFLENKGISTNVASFVGATTARIYTVGYENRPPTEVELDSMRMLVREAMEEGAMGVGSSLIYAPAFYSSTEELIELAKVASEYDGMYISHMRSEGNNILGSIDELIRIADEADIRAEIYHLKMG